MCEFCTKHGEGKKWYLNAKNYSQDLLSDLHRRKFVTNFFYWIHDAYHKAFPILKRLPLNMPILGKFSKSIISKFFKREHWAQVVPIEEVEKILSITNSVVRIPCICRKVTTGKEVRSCFVTTLDPAKIGVAELLDQSYFGGPDVAQFEAMDKSQALAYMKDQESTGRFHLVWTHVTPFIAGMCNCDDTGCITYKLYDEVSPIFFKSEFLAEVNKDTCVGCKSCMSVCKFRAISIDDVANKAVINTALCYGCGICRSVCKKNSILLYSRCVHDGAPARC